MNSIADLVANHRDYCAAFYPYQGMMVHVDSPKEITIEEYNRRVQKHLTMTVNRIKKLTKVGSYAEAS